MLDGNEYIVHYVGVFFICFRSVLYTCR